MQWHHSVSAKWMQARKSVVTATELRDLRTAYKKLDPAEINSVFAGLWAEKHSTLVDTGSSGAAARGHILEPYAVAEASKILGKKFFHWDDALVANGFLGCSPDALDIPQSTSKVKLTPGEVEQARELLEIKSYSPKTHIQTVLKDKMDCDERWQIAGAFAVMPELEQAHLVLYNPSHVVGCHVKTYARQDLQHEISTIKDIYRAYLDQASLIESKLEPLYHKTQWTETDIWESEMSEPTL